MQTFQQELLLIAQGSSKTQRILINLIEAKFPSLPDSIGELLSWNMWPVILTALGE